MGNREALLAGAKRCLYERGYTRPTSREIADAAGVSMGAISYHFGSREALLNEALIEAMLEWGAEVDAAVAAVSQEGPAGGHFETVWSRIVDSMVAHPGLWAATLEAFSRTDHPAEVRTQLSAALARARVGLARLLHPTGLSEDEEWKLGSIYQALLSGLALQWLLDADRSLSGPDLADALRVMAARIS
ncbi:TetR/AcrR family transcriptional regulator [Microbacterium sp. CFH 90308]|uniref:TetR/AcrR family transcriptional regulator n=1 Tax=Microbacterium salsuginis TaxID=2722803 RepID=A0ABX1KG82_9MICO|nr:TetR/AcrR family transcriptional regulator [Microbacterium sp. CFH 90308]NLP85278.1 TetR/AcrR family transcriptional regulator [Microbacterium sp. CFH 90308]